MSPNRTAFLEHAREAKSQYDDGYRELADITLNLAMLVRRLVRAAERGRVSEDLKREALEYLIKKDLKGNPFRMEEA